MTQDAHETDVIFRRFKTGNKAVIALFPALCGTNDHWATCDSYMRIGQHGGASVYLAPVTIPASVAEKDVMQLALELKRLGYCLRIVKRFTPKHRQARYEQIHNTKGN